MPTFISASPHRGQSYERCLARPEIEQAAMALSMPGHLTVRLREGVSDEVAEEIAECLRSLAGKPWTVEVSHRL